MAGLIAAMVVGATSEGIERIKSKRAERKEQRRKLQASADSESSGAQDERESRASRFAESKAREASAERRRRIEEEQTELEPNSPGAEVGTHPALRDPSQPIARTKADDDAPPPPYVKDAPSYEEHFAHPVSEVQPLSSSRPLQ